MIKIALDENDIYFVMKKFIGGLEFAGNNIPWHLEGKVNLLVQGVKTDTKDIDIATTLEGFNFFKDTLCKGSYFKFVEEGVVSSWHGYHYITYESSGTLIDIAYYDEPAFAMMEKTRPFAWNSLKLQVTPLPDAKKFYEMVGKSNMAKMIAKYI